MNLLNRIKKMEQATGGNFIWLSSLIPISGEDVKIHKNKIIPLWVEAWRNPESSLLHDKVKGISRDEAGIHHLLDAYKDTSVWEDEV
jgi:hypothetical protein